MNQTTKAIVFAPSRGPCTQSTPAEGPLMTQAALFAIMQLLDGLTMFALPAGSEMNPIAATNPVAGFMLKLALIAFVLLAPLGRYRHAVMTIGLILGSVGVGANLSVIL